MEVRLKRKKEGGDEIAQPLWEKKKGETKIKDLERRKI